MRPRCKGNGQCGAGDAARAGSAGGRCGGAGGRRSGVGGWRGQSLLLERLDELDDAWRVFRHGAANAVVQVAREERADAIERV